MALFPKNILLVEDDEDDVFFITQLILEKGKKNPPKVTHAETPQLAIEYLAKQSFDICLFDYRLGEMDGINLLQLVRSKGIGGPIILLTGHGDQEIAVQAMKSGATDYLVKSKLTAQSLEQSIRHAIQIHKEEELRKGAEDKLKKSNEELTTANRELQISMEKLRAAQNQILRSEKLASIGRLAAGVCHEILNPLNIISGHTQALKMEREEDRPLLDDLNSIMEEIGRIEKIISGLLKFSRKEEMEIKKVDIIKDLNSVLSIMEKDMLLDNIRVVRNFDAKLPELHLDADRMRQVFLNIINNAKHSMQGGGTLTVTTSKVLKEPKKRRRSTDIVQYDQNMEQGSDVPFFRISFCDTGAGIRSEDMSRLFDPFFTTKPEDKGTGLGLSVCHTIVEKHGGNIEVQSEFGKGATFIIDLPFERENHRPSFLAE